MDRDKDRIADLGGARNLPAARQRNSGKRIVVDESRGRKGRRHVRFAFAGRIARGKAGPSPDRIGGMHETGAEVSCAWIDPLHASRGDIRCANHERNRKE